MNTVADSIPAPFEVRPLSKLMAAEVVGLDLRIPLDRSTLDAVYAAFVKYQVLAFRDQDLSPEQQIRFSEQFGQLEKHIASNENSDIKAVHTVTNLDDSGTPTGKVGSQDWHTDKSFRAKPSLATILHAKRLPPSGGETCFANMYHAYEALDEDEKAQLEGLQVVHSWELSRANVGRVIPEEEKRDAPPRPQPLVRYNPDSGRKSLFLGSHASHIDGMDFDAGRALVVGLEKRATQSLFIYQHDWRPGDVLMWDNRCLLHKANSNFNANRHARVMHRTCLRGHAPAQGYPAG